MLGDRPQNWYWKLVDREPVPCAMEEFRISHVADDTFGNERVGEVRVSTIFLGLDHNHSDGPPILFETMIFGGELHDYQTRCATYSEAEAMHAIAVALVRRSFIKLIPDLAAG